MRKPLPPGKTYSSDRAITDLPAEKAKRQLLKNSRMSSNRVELQDSLWMKTRQSKLDSGIPWRMLPKRKS